MSTGRRRGVKGGRMREGGRWTVAYAGRRADARLDLPSPAPSSTRTRRGRPRVPDLPGRAAVRRVGGPALDDAGRAARDHANELREEEPDLLGVGVTPAVAIGQRALLVRTPAGNVLWDCVPVLDDARSSAIGSLGGIAAVAISHPHFYAANVDIADAFDATVFLPHADRAVGAAALAAAGVLRRTGAARAGVTVARIGGHFDGAAVLHWPAGSEGRGALLTGDTITVVQDRAWVSFMWSYPNLIPLDERTVDDIARRVERFTFDRIYGGWWGRVVVRDGAAAVRRSADRYIARARGERADQAAHRSRASLIAWNTSAHSPSKWRTTHSGGPAEERRRLGRRSSL